MFTIKSAVRLSAAKKKKQELNDVKDLSDSSLDRIAKDDTDPRSHDAFTEIMHRNEQKEEAEKRSSNSNKKKKKPLPPIFDDDDSELLDFGKPSKPSKVDTPKSSTSIIKPIADKLETKEAQDSANIGIELVKALL
jgi:hypothetical protein|nr:MAG TPA: hypothetical protein [Caudoviricetes sp.]